LQLLLSPSSAAGPLAAPLPERTNACQTPARRVQERIRLHPAMARTRRLPPERPWSIRVLKLVRPPDLARSAAGLSSIHHCGIRDRSRLESHRTARPRRQKDPAHAPVLALAHVPGVLGLSRSR